MPTGKGHFADSLIDGVRRKGPLVVGIDPNFSLMPAELLPASAEPPAVRNALERFGRLVVDATADLVPAVKPQSAYFEQFGTKGVEALASVVRYSREKGLLVILDGKRGDIDATSLAYAKGYLSGRTKVGALELISDLEADCLTVNPFLGEDAVLPFVETAAEHGKGIFVLVKTSNPGSGFLQGLRTGDGTVSELLAQKIDEWGSGTVGASGYGNVGAVVGATYPEQAAALRKLMPRAIVLVPGAGTQGGSVEAAKANLNPDGLGAVISISRSVTFPSPEEVAAAGYEGAVRARLRKFIEAFAGGTA